MALGALASTVAAAGAAVAPYAPTLLPVLSHFTSATAPDAIPARCRAVECAGLVIEGLGKSPESAEAAALLQVGYVYARIHPAAVGLCVCARFHPAMTAAVEVVV